MKVCYQLIESSCAGGHNMEDICCCGSFFDQFRLAVLAIEQSGFCPSEGEGLNALLPCNIQLHAEISSITFVDAI